MVQSETKTQLISESRSLSLFSCQNNDFQFKNYFLVVNSETQDYQHQLKTLDFNFHNIRTHIK